MKNGDPRSANWIKRNLPRYLREMKRDDEATRDLLSLVLHKKELPLEVVAGWTDEQRLLAEDWAGAVHLSASDNNNRVPAMPEFLNQYR